MGATRDNSVPLVPWNKGNQHVFWWKGLHVQHSWPRHHKYSGNRNPIYNKFKKQEIEPSGGSRRVSEHKYWIYE